MAGRSHLSLPGAAESSGRTKIVDSRPRKRLMGTREVEGPKVVANVSLVHHD